MPEDLAQTLVVVAIVMVVVGLLLAAGLVYVVVRFKPRIMTVVAAVGALLYGLSPVDAVPEALLGPVGTLDDLAVWAVAAFAMFREVQRRREQESAAGRGPASPAAGATGSTGRGPEAGGGRQRDAAEAGAAPRPGAARGASMPGDDRVVVGEVLDAEDEPYRQPR